MESLNSIFDGLVQSMGMGVILALIFLPAIIMLVSSWVLYQKASQPGWASIVPIYSSIVLTKIINRPTWWVLLLFIPTVGQIISIIMMYELVKSFGKGFGYFFGFLLLPFIFQPMLAFGGAKYIGTSTSPVANPQQPLAQTSQQPIIPNSGTPPPPSPPIV